MLGKNKCIVIVSMKPSNKIFKCMVPESGIEILGRGTECRYNENVFFSLSTEGKISTECKATIFMKHSKCTYIACEFHYLWLGTFG